MLSATSAPNLDFIAFEKEFCVKMIEFVFKKSETDEITSKQVFPTQNFRSDTRKDKSGNFKKVSCIFEKYPYQAPSVSNLSPK